MIAMKVLRARSEEAGESESESRASEEGGSEGKGRAGDCVGFDSAFPPLNNEHASRWLGSVPTTSDHGESIYFSFIFSVINPKMIMAVRFPQLPLNK